MKRIIRKLGNQRYKKLLAAVAGAAVISSAMMPGLPAAQAKASDDTPRQEHKSERHRNDDHAIRLGDPVRKVKENAATFGFNVSRDQFSLLSISRDSATVQVRSGGRTYKVDLKRSGQDWMITTIRGIGDSSHAATYVPASMFPGYTLSPAASQLILYQNTNFDNWQWLDSTYTPGTAFGVLLVNPRLAGTTAEVPAAVATQADSVDFNRQFLLYGSLRGVSGDGYGIALSKVVQTGNDFTVTVRTKSPQSAGTASQTDSWVLLDRSFLNFSDPVVITFVNPAGAVLSTLTLTGR